ncbi:PilZ domain-containing protein [Altererythrobacter sp. CAU 1778]
MDRVFKPREERQQATVDLTALLLTLDERLREVQLVDLSVQGCRLRGVIDVIEPGTAVAIRLPGLSEYVFGKIAWGRGDMVGIELLEPLFEPVYRYLKDKLFGAQSAA